MKIVLYDRMEDNRPKPLDLEWGGPGSEATLTELLSLFREVDCTPCPGKKCPHKDGPAWSPVDIVGSRLNDHVVSVSAAVLDFDHLSPDQFLAALDRLEGINCLIYSTHAHTSADICVRVVLELSRPVPAKDWRTVLKTIIAELDLPADPSCKDLSRLYFLPTARKGFPRISLRGDGQPINVDTVLQIAQAALGQLPPAKPPLSVAKPVAERFELLRADLDDLPEVRSYDLLSLTERLRELRYRKARSSDPLDRERYHVLDRLLKAQPLAVPGHYKPEEIKALGLPPDYPRGRDPAINQAATLIAFALPTDTPSEAAIELLRPSILSMECEPEGIDHWLAEATDCYERAAKRRAIRDGEREAQDREIRERLKGLLPRPPSLPSAVSQDLKEPPPMGGPLVPTQKPGQAEQPPPVEPDQEQQVALDSWRDLLIKKADGSLKQCGENAFIILAFSEETRGTLRWNEVEKTIEVWGGPFFNTHSSVLDAEVADWLMRFHGLSLSEQVVGTRIARVAYANKYDPLAEYLSNLSWDGTDRINDFLIRYAGARTTNQSGCDITQHIRRIGCRFLISAVARALNPGTKVDTVLIIEGEQGERKSTMLEVLGGKWYSGDALALGDKDSKMLAANHWIIEIAELDSFHKAENRTKKNFFAQRVDKFRPPYARMIMSFPRRAVFGGTVNPEDGHYFTDSTGNRRYWPFFAEKIDINALRRDRDQVWAQAVEYYRRFLAHQKQGIDDDDNPYKWWLTRAEQKEADKEADERMKPSIIEGKIFEWWALKSAGKRPDFITTADIAETVLMFSLDRIDQRLITEIGVAMRRLGFLKDRPMINGRQTYGFRPSDELRDLPQSGNRAHLKSIALAKVG